jgi:hypothetical protein
VARVSEIRTVQEGPDVRVSGHLEVGGKHFDAFYLLRNQEATQVTDAGDAFATVTLMAAMHAGEDLSVAGAVSPQLVTGLDRIMDLWTEWHPALRKVVVHAESASTDIAIPPAPGVGMFFSGGVDSLYSLMKWVQGPTGPAHQRLTHIVFLLGFDPGTTFRGASAAADDRLAMAMQSAERVASKYGVKMIVVESNVRQFTDQFFGWAHYHGAVLASTAHLVSGTIGTMAIASTERYADLAPWGTHALTDHLFSTERVRIFHDGAERSRAHKIDALVEGFQQELNELRVCWNENSSDFNCCACQKCLQTMIRLRLHGALDTCTAFNKALDLGSVRNADFRRPNLVREWRRLVKDVRASEGMTALYWSMRYAIVRGARQERRMLANR